MPAPENGWRFPSEQDMIWKRVKPLLPFIAIGLTVVGMAGSAAWTVASSIQRHVQQTERVAVTVEEMGKDLKTIKDLFIQRGMK